MRICFVYQADYPWDIRVEKIAATLTQAGNEVHLIAANRRGLSRSEVREEAHVRRLPSVNGKWGPLNSLVNLPVFMNPFWWREIDVCVRTVGAELILVRDLPLALTAASVGRRRGIPVVMDMAECYPEMMRAVVEYGDPSAIKRLTHSPQLAAWVERRAARAVDHTFVMVEESEARWKALGVAPDRVSIVSNTPPLHKFDMSRTASRPHRSAALHLLYAGWVTKARGLDTVVAGLGKFVRKHDTPVRLTVIGDGNGLSQIRKQVADHSLENIVDLLGWQDHSRVVEYTAIANVGLVPHHVTGHSNTTIPNKLFDYMAAGLPVLASDAKPIARILEETGAGMVYEDWNADSFSESLLRFTDPGTRQAMAVRGQLAVVDRYNWDRDGAQLLKDLGAVATRAQSGGGR